MKQQGFTLIELVMVIVVLGVLAAVAVPKFVNLSSDAQAASDKMSTNANTASTKASAACTAMSANLPNTTCVP